MESSTGTTASAPTVAVLGTGIMGTPMARNIAAAGLPTRVWNRTRSKAEPLAASGARVCDTADEAVAGANVIVTMLKDGDSVRELVEGLASPPQGAVWAQTTTVGPEAAADLAVLAERRGLVLVDAPVVGTKAPAEKGALTVLAAGSPAARDRVAPVFDAIGARTDWLADSPGAASRLKLVVNSWVLALTAATGEAVALAHRLDIDPQLFLDTVSGGPLDSAYLHVKAAAILGGDFDPSFSVANAAKDAHLVVASARAAGLRLDLAEASAARLDRAADFDHADDDMAAGYFASFPDGRP